MSVDVERGFADATMPRIDRFCVDTATGAIRCLFGTPTAGATLENLRGLAPLPKGCLATTDPAYVLVPPGSGSGFCKVRPIHASRIEGVITIVVPLDSVGPEDTSEAKRGAARLLLDDCIDALGSRWSDAAISVEYQDGCTCGAG